MSEEKKKAIDLVDNFTQLIFESGNSVSKPMVIQCAKLCVNEIIKSLPNPDDDAWYLERRESWKSVLTELNNM